MLWAENFSFTPFCISRLSALRSYKYTKRATPTPRIHKAAGYLNGMIKLKENAV
jgi:hypothetical protein